MAIETYTPSQERARQLLDRGYNVFITGRPGTGKTEFINDYCATLGSQGKRVLLTASTGLAASNLNNGRTLHSILKWHPHRTDYDYNICTELLKRIDVLVVDEVSMLCSSIIEHLCICLERMILKPQLIMIGDFFQLPPVARNNIERHYPFENYYWSKLNLHICILNEVVRQTDKEFLEMLDQARYGNACCIKYFNDKTRSQKIKDAITICTQNDETNKINLDMMNRLPGTVKFCEAIGNVEDANFNQSRFLKTLEVKLEMRVMSIQNDICGNYHNGSLGTVKTITNDYIGVLFDHGNYIKIRPVICEIENIHSEKPPVKILQYPLRGGAAITIHKSQGQTFEAANIIADNCWESGQLYVALSRVKTISGIHLMKKLTANSLKTDRNVIEYYTHLEHNFAY